MGDELPQGACRRLTGGLRLLLLSAAVLAGVSAIGHPIGWVLLMTALGSTAYVVLAHPDSAAARARNVVLGHGCTITTALAALAVFGLWSRPSGAETMRDDWRQIGAEPLGVGLTLLILHVTDCHHAPAAATFLLLTSGIARPGPPLCGLFTGLALVLLVTPVAAKAYPGVRRARGRERSRTRGYR